MACVFTALSMLNVQYAQGVPHVKISSALSMEGGLDRCVHKCISLSMAEYTAMNTLYFFATTY